MGFSDKVDKFRNRLIEKLEANRNKNLENIFYGTGCRASTLINGLNISNYIDYIVDDQPEKQSLIMPGSRLKIKSSDVLNNLSGSCFLSVNHENEEKVIEKHKKYIENGGKFYSLNSPSPLFI